MNRIIESVLIPVCIVLTALMLATTVWGVTARLSGISAPWTDKAMLILLPTLAFAAAPVAYRRSANVSLDLLRDALPPRLKAVHGLLVHLAILLLLLVGLDLTLRKVGVDPGWLSILIQALTGLDLTTIRPFAAPMRIPVINIQWKYVYMIMPAGIVLTIIGNIELLCRHALALFSPEQTRVPPIRSAEASESGLWD